jgi:acetyl-CoA C-acetyltransferase
MPGGHLKTNVPDQGKYKQRGPYTTTNAVQAVLPTPTIRKGFLDIHEAFAAQVLAYLNELELTADDFDRINVNRSCIAIGHPLGTTGARILTTLVHEMHRRSSHYGLIAICGGGGMGVAAVIGRP